MKNQIVSTKITQGLDNAKITRERLENKMVGTKIARPRDVRHKNNSPKGWMGGELYGRHENNSPKAGELNGRHENNFPKGWTGGELYGRH